MQDPDRDHVPSVPGRAQRARLQEGNGMGLFRSSVLSQITIGFCDNIRRILSEIITTVSDITACSIVRNMYTYC